MSVGMPAAIYLDAFGALVYRAFGERAYHVGSSLRKKIWRDVDVRVMLDDATYARLELGDPKAPHENARWVALCLAFSALGKQMTGLPIDFQIQTLTEANELFGRAKGGERSCLGIRSPMDMPETFPAVGAEGRAIDELIDRRLAADTPSAHEDGLSPESAAMLERGLAVGRAGRVVPAPWSIPAAVLAAECPHGHPESPGVACRYDGEEETGWVCLERLFEAVGAPPAAPGGPKEGT